MELRHRLQQSTGTSTGACIGAQDVNHHLTINGLIRFRERINVPDDNELKKLILREFHVKPYSGHLGYHITLTVVKKFYYFLNLKK